MIQFDKHIFQLGETIPIQQFTASLEYCFCLTQLYCKNLAALPFSFSDQGSSFWPKRMIQISVKLSQHHGANGFAARVEGDMLISF